MFRCLLEHGAYILVVVWLPQVYHGSLQEVSSRDTATTTTSTTTTTPTTTTSATTALIATEGDEDTDTHTCKERVARQWAVLESAGVALKPSYPKCNLYIY